MFLLLGLLLTRAAADSPNVILLYTDDQGYGDASCLNPEAKFQTPNLDRLAAEGIAFTNAHSSDTVCTPSRYGLLTGRYAWRTSLKQGVMGAEGACLIPPGRPTLASLLRDRGYDTAMVGKWHLGMDFPGTGPDNRDWTEPVRDMPLDKGFDYFFGIPASLNYGILAWFEGRFAETPPTLFTAKKPNARHVDYRIIPPYQSSPEETRRVLGHEGMEVAPDFADDQCLTRFTDKAIAWMGRHGRADRGRPIFLYLPLTSPHYPVCPLPRFHGEGECGAYGEFVIETDHHVGRILDFLADAGLEENTLIIFTSDNGPERSWVERIEEFDHDSSGVYRGGKRDIYEGGHRVPFLVRWPGGIVEPGRVSDALIGQVDIFATLADLTGGPTSDGGEDSFSFAPILFEPEADSLRVPLVNHGMKGRFAVTNHESWKLILPHGSAGEELYHLQSDPGEERNVVAERPALADRLRSVITRIVVRGRSTPGPVVGNDTGYWNDLTWMTREAYASANGGAMERPSVQP